MSQPFTDGLRDGRIGRVPIWAIGVGLAALIIVFMLFRNRSASVPAQQIDTGFGELEDTYGLPGGPVGDFLAGNPLDPAYPTYGTVEGTPGPLTNVQWTRLVGDWLLGQGNDPELVGRALVKYIRAMPLTAEEQAIVNLALQHMGPPPEGFILPEIPEDDEDPPTQPPPTQPPPTQPPPSQPPPPAARRYVIVARYTTSNPPWNSTLSGIAKHEGVSLDQIKQWNGFSPYGSRNPNLIYTGEKIWTSA